jgi:hypothetical protein
LSGFSVSCFSEWKHTGVDTDNSYQFDQNCDLSRRAERNDGTAQHGNSARVLNGGGTVLMGMTIVRVGHCEVLFRKMPIRMLPAGVEIAVERAI